MGSHRALTTVPKIVTCGNWVLRSCDRFSLRKPMTAKAYPGNAAGERRGRGWTPVCLTETASRPPLMPPSGPLPVSRLLSGPSPQSTMRENVQDSRSSQKL